MATVIVTWTTKQQAFPVETGAGIWHVQIMAADGVTEVSAPAVNPAGNSVSFANIGVGSYVAKVKRFNAANTGAIATAQSGFSVAAQTANQDIPDVVNVAVQ